VSYTNCFTPQTTTRTIFLTVLWFAYGVDKILLIKLIIMRGTIPFHNAKGYAISSSLQGPVFLVITTPIQLIRRAVHAILENSFTRI